MASLARKWLVENPIRARTNGVRMSIVFEAVALYAVCFVMLSALIFTTPGFLGNDDYYHARLGGEIAEQGRLAIDFPWLPRTILSADRFVDHHLLYHIYLAPWVQFGGMAGTKWAQVAIAAGVFLAMWWLLRQVGVRWAALWSLGLFALSSPFLYRLLMIRTQGASLLLLLLALIVMFQCTHRWLIPLSFAYTWLYDGFILIPAFALLYAVGTWIADRRLDWQPVLYASLGVMLGLAINPYFPRNVLFIIEHLGAKVAFEGGVQVGSEWYPYTTGVLLANSGGALLVLLIGFLRPSFDGQRRDRIENTLLWAALVTLFMLLRSRRFIEYYPPFALLFCAVSWGRKPISMFQTLPKRLGKLILVAVLIPFVVLIGVTITKTQQTIETVDDPRWFVGAANWLAAHTPEGTPVFQTDWDDFTRLFYYNSSNTYLVGLDPTYLERADLELWTQWVAITRGEVEQPSNVIRSQFGAAYVVSDRSHEAFADRAADDPNMKLVYWDRNSMVWQITP